MSTDPLDAVREIAARESGLAVVATFREDGSAQASVVNAGVVSHPVTGESMVGFAVRGRRRKLVNLRARPRTTIVFRSGWDWVAVEGDAELAGPDDAIEGFDPGAVPRLLREIYAAAVGGTADDWTGMDQQMADEGHSAVLVRPQRVYSNPSE
ncbi:MAG: pyridoxamine 5'-phosphate oxidase family protein [Acidimicrobiia bacterium]